MICCRRKTQALDGGNNLFRFIEIDRVFAEHITELHNKLPNSRTTNNSIQRSDFALCERLVVEADTAKPCFPNAVVYEPSKVFVNVLVIVVILPLVPRC